MATNKRIFYATQGVKLTPVDSNGTASATPLTPGGLQSAGVTTNFNLEKIFQLGQLELYDSVENNPEVEVTLNKVFDGTKPLFLITMGGHTSNTNPISGSLVAFQNNRVNLDLFVHQDTNQGTASSTAVSKLTCTGLYASNFSYTFPVDGNATEEVTLVGTNKTWSLNPSSAAVFSTDATSKGTARRWKFAKDLCVFPTGDGGMPSGSPLTNVTVSFDLGREAIYTLGEYEPYLRFVNFPVEISTEITSVGMDGDFLNLSDSLYSCTGVSNVKNKAIKLVICGGSGESDKLTIDLGSKNKLQSVNYTGGDTGGGNVEISYSFTTDNTFIMISSGTFQSAAVTALSASEQVPYVFGDNK
jgi:hypothetical protein